MPDEGSPSFAADRSDEIGLRTGRRRTQSNALPTELRPEGRRDSNPRPLDPEGTPVCATGRSLCRDIDGCEATVRTRTSWFRARRGTSSTTSHRSGRRARTSNPRLRTPVRFRSQLAREVAGAGIEPACEAYGTSLIPDLPLCDGVTGRTRTGFLRAHNPACRPLQLRPPSTREESNLRPACVSRQARLPLEPTRRVRWSAREPGDRRCTPLRAFT